MDDETQLPDGNTPGKTEVDVTVKYPDGTEDHIKSTCNSRNRYSSTRCTNSGCPRSRSRYTVTGTGSEPGNTITVTFPDGTTGTGTVGEDGSWSVEVPGGTGIKQR